MPIARHAPTNNAQILRRRRTAKLAMTVAARPKSSVNSRIKFAKIDVPQIVLRLFGEVFGASAVSADASIRLRGSGYFALGRAQYAFGASAVSADASIRLRGSGYFALGRAQYAFAGCLFASCLACLRQAGGRKCGRLAARGAAFVRSDGAVQILPKKANFIWN